MQILTVRITKELIEESFKTGHDIRRCVVSRGLPSDAKLVDAQMQIDGILELKFQTDKAITDKEISIEITTMMDA